MSITSYNFLVFFAIVLLLYYIVPKKVQWVVLLFASIAYYLLSEQGILLLYPVAAAFVSWLGIRLIADNRAQEAAFTAEARKKEKAIEDKEERKKAAEERKTAVKGLEGKRRVILMSVILANVVVLFLLKYITYSKMHKS